MTTQSLCSTTPSEGTTPIVLSAVGQELEWGLILKHLPPDRPWVLLATDDQKDDIAPYIQQPIFKTLPAESTAMWGYSFWQGTAGLFPETWDTPINVYTSSAISQHQQKRITQAIYARCLTDTALPVTANTDFQHLFPETPPTITTILSEPTLTPEKLQLLCGVVSQASIADWHLTTPPMLHQKLYRNIHRAIIEHQHSIWLQRNSDAHPLDEVPVIIIRDKKRKRIHKPLDIESDTTNDAWVADREDSLIIQEMWKGTPAPKRQKQAPLKEVVEVEEKGWGKVRPEEEIDVGIQRVRAISTTTDISGTTVTIPPHPHPAHTSQLPPIHITHPLTTMMDRLHHNQLHTALPTHLPLTPLTLHAHPHSTHVGKNAF